MGRTLNWNLSLKTILCLCAGSKVFYSDSRTAHKSIVGHLDTSKLWEKSNESYEISLGWSIRYSLFLLESRPSRKKILESDSMLEAMIDSIAFIFWDENTTSCIVGMKSLPLGWELLHSVSFKIYNCWTHESGFFGMLVTECNSSHPRGRHFIPTIHGVVF